MEAMKSLRGGWLWVLVASLALTTVSGNQCYLEDADATCAICWTTTADVTKMAACPNTIHARWVTPLAATMYADVRYSATYELTLDAAAFVPIDQQVKDEAGVSLGEFTVPHANIHSCPTSRGACTPFVANSPGLATHTAAEQGSVGQHGDTMRFRSDVQLTAGQYTIIAHYRFFVNATHPTACDEPTQPCLTQYDVAMGMRRDVLLPPPTIEADAYVTAGVVGMVLALCVGSVYWASRAGQLDLELILNVLCCEEVTLCSDALFGVGDITAFTVSLFTAVWHDRKLQDLVPLCILFLCTGWAASIIIVYLAFTQLSAIRKMHVDESVYVRHLVDSYSKEAVQQGEGGGTPVVRRVSFTLAKQLEADKKESLVTNLAIARRELHRKVGDIVTIVAEAAPLTALQGVVLVRGSSVSVVVVITFLLAAVMLGAKVSGLFNFPLAHKEYRKWAHRMEEEYGELIVKTSVRDLRCEQHEAAETAAPAAMA